MSIRFQVVLLGIVAASMAAVATSQGVQGPGRQPAQAGGLPEQMIQMERQDFGVPPARQLYGGAMHAPTPATIPGGQSVTTSGLVALLQGAQAPYVVLDVLGGTETLPGAVPAVWMAQPGSFDDGTQRQAEQMLEQLAQGRKDVALVFYCLSRECWMSYNASLRAIHAGYANVLWYRGGIEAWKQAGLPTQQGQQGSQANFQQIPQQNLQQNSQQVPRAKFQSIVPLAPGAGVPATATQSAGELRIGQARFFSFAQPQGWRIGEDGQFALTQVAPDNRAFTVMVGNAGLPVNTPPARFAYDRLSALRPQNLQFGEARQARPAAGFHQAVEFQVSYVAAGVPYLGVAKVSVAPGYDSATMALTAALAAADQWGGYASWLPQVADLVSASNGAAFGMRGIMQQNLQNSVAFGKAAQQYREWSQKNWQGVVDERDKSQERRNFAVRENLGGVQTFSNPYGTAPVELPMTNKHYWTDRQGRVVGTDDPGADPNLGSTGDWRRMERVGR